MDKRLLAGIALGVALSLFGPVLQAVGSHSGSHQDPYESEIGIDVQRAAAAEWWREYADGDESFKLSVWRRDEVYTAGSFSVGIPRVPSRFVDGRVTLVRRRCLDEGACTDLRMTASLHDRGNRFVAEAGAGAARLAATLNGDAGSCSIRVTWTPSSYDGLVSTPYRGFDAVEISGRAEATGEGSCLPVTYPRNRFARVWERVQRVIPNYTLPEAGISTLSGVGSSGFDGDGGPARWAWLFQPSDVAIRKRPGNVTSRSWRYAIADTHNNRIRVIDDGGGIHTVAGNGTCNGPRAGDPTTVAVCYPASVAFAPDGSLLFSSYWGHVVQRIGADGTVEVIAGGGVAAGDGVGATEASLSRPSGLAVDRDGRLCIADQGSNRVRRIDSDGKIRTVAGDGTCREPADGGPALATSFCAPSDVAVDSMGVIYVVEEAGRSRRLRRVDRDGTTSTVLESFGAAQEPLDQAGLGYVTELAPTGVAIGPGDAVYVSDRYRVLRVVRPGITYTIAGGTTCEYHGDGGPAQAAGVCLPAGLDVHSDGSVVFAELASHVIRHAKAAG